MPFRPLTQTTLLATGLAMVVLMGGCGKLPEPTGPVTLLDNSAPLATPADDAAVTASVRQALLADPVMSGFDLQVDTQQGTVQLSGIVNHQAQIARALAITHGMAGVKTVENSLTLKSNPGIVGTQTEQPALSWAAQ